MRTDVRYWCVLLLATALAGALPAFAQVMQSTNYRIQEDSVNVGGGYATSSSYHLEDTTGEAATGYSSSTNYALQAGYQQSGDPYLALSSAADVTMTPALGGLTGGTANGSTTVTATTDNPAGYQLTIAASTSPALKDGTASIADYVPAGGNPDFTFTTSATESHLGFSPEGADITTRYKDNGSGCNTGSGDTTLACWDGLSTTPIAIASRTSSNQPSGTDTTLNFRVGIGSSAAQREGLYIATSTLTLVAL